MSADVAALKEQLRVSEQKKAAERSAMESSQYKTQLLADKLKELEKVNILFYFVFILFPLVHHPVIYVVFGLDQAGGRAAEAAVYPAGETFSRGEERDHDMGSQSGGT